MRPRHLRATPFAAAALTLAAALTTPPLQAQEVRLAEPEAAFPEDFGTIQTVRELSDGRVLVADPLGKALYAVDLDAGARAVVGSEGQGPEEYRQPDAVWPLPGDSTLLVDLGNGRLVALGPELEFGPTMPIAAGRPRPGRPLALAIPQGVDGEGNVYIRQVGGGMGGGELPDSSVILRLRRSDRSADTAATFKVEERRINRSGGANNRNVSIETIPLSGEDAWGVAEDGSVAVARTADYHLEWMAPDGSVTRGSAVPYEAVGIGTAEKEEYVAEQARSGGGVGIRMENVNGRMSMSFQRGGGPGGPREIDTYTWPDRKPPFYGGRIPIDRQGRAWVRRHLEAGEDPLYDVFDRRGERVGSVRLVGLREVVGFGDGAVYVVAYDEFDLSYLERYAMPAL